MSCNHVNKSPRSLRCFDADAPSSDYAFYLINLRVCVSAHTPQPRVKQPKQPKGSTTSGLIWIICHGQHVACHVQMPDHRYHCNHHAHYQEQGTHCHIGWQKGWQCVDKTRGTLPHHPKSATVVPIHRAPRHSATFVSPAAGAVGRHTQVAALKICQYRHPQRCVSSMIVHR